MIDLLVAGEPKGKARPRFDTRSGRTYTPTPTLRAEQRIQNEWIAAERPVLDGPLAMTVTIVLVRPQAHWKRDGSLSAAGQRAPWPLRTPDVDNALKLVADALNGLAYRDDALIVQASITRRWANAGEREFTQIRIVEVVDRQVAA